LASADTFAAFERSGFLPFFLKRAQACHSEEPAAAGDEESLFS
jgi:hypothetical protein